MAAPWRSHGCAAASGSRCALALSSLSPSTTQRASGSCARAAAALLDDAAKCEEGTRKAMMRAAKTKLMTHVMTHLDVAKNLLHGEKEKSPAAAGQPSRSV